MRPHKGSAAAELLAPPGEPKANRKRGLACAQNDDEHKLIGLARAQELIGDDVRRMRIAFGLEEAPTEMKGSRAIRKGIRG